MTSKILSNAQIIERLKLPDGKIDIVIDTDTYNEVDDQFALVYALRSHDRLNVKAIYAAPFFNSRASSPADGMEKSYDEIFKVMDRMNLGTPDNFVKKGSTRYLQSVDTPCKNDAAYDLIEKALAAKNPLYIVAIGAITNIASAILLEPKILSKIIVVWLGGHAFGWPDTVEFNLKQDVLAANVIFDSGVPLVLLPCKGVVSHLSTTLPELEKHIEKSSPIGAYLTQNIREYQKDKYVFSKVIWDAAAIAYLINSSWVQTKIMSSPSVSDKITWSFDDTRHPIKYAYGVDRDAIFADIFKKIRCE